MAKHLIITSHRLKENSKRSGAMVRPTIQTDIVGPVKISEKYDPGS